MVDESKSRRDKVAESDDSMQRLTSGRHGGNIVLISEKKTNVPTTCGGR